MNFFKIGIAATLIFQTSLAFAGLSTWQVSKERVESKIELLKNNVTFPFRKFYWVKLSNKEEPNAYSVGTHIVVTKSLLKKLNERELLAVVAHEMAHREKHHQFKRLGMYFGGAVAALFDFNNDRGFTDRYTGFNSDIMNIQELEADCLAYNWLLELKHRGFRVDPKDLNRATTKVMGVDFGRMDPEYVHDLPPYIRYMKVKEGHPTTCDY